MVVLGVGTACEIALDPPSCWCVHSFLALQGHYRGVLGGLYKTLWRTRGLFRFVQTYIHKYILISSKLNISMYLYICICIYVHIYTHIGRFKGSYLPAAPGQVSMVI